MSLYDFVDTTEAQGANKLPTEALKINGIYLEDEIEGYRTLYVTGREAMSAEVMTYDIGRRDGTVRQWRRYPERTITVGYQLKAADAAAYRAAYSRLNMLISGEDMELIFADEPDKYFIGSSAEAGEVGQPGRNVVTGELTFVCTDPYKYALEEKEVVADSSGVINVAYDGTARCYPTLEASFIGGGASAKVGYAKVGYAKVGYVEDDSTDAGAGDCGYVAWTDESGHIIQLGDPDEDNINVYAKSQTLIYQNWKDVSAWTSGLESVWEFNKGALTGGFNATNGTLAFAKITGGSSDDDGYVLSAIDYGSASSSESSDSSYHGASLYGAIPADAAGETGADNWRVSWSLYMEGSKNTERGNFELVVCTAAGKIIAGAQIIKGSTEWGAYLRLYAWGSIIKEVTPIALSPQNSSYGLQAGEHTCYIEKDDTTITYHLGRKTYSYYLDQSSSKAADYQTAGYIVIAFGQKYSYDTLMINGVRAIKFVKNNCTDMVDIPNKFSRGDVVIADCGKSEVTLNGASEPSLGALGNDWEDFVLTPGDNKITASWSSWVESGYEPTFRLRYREVYL